MNALDRADVYGFLDFLIRGPCRVNHLGEPQTIVQFKNLRTNLFARTAGDTLIFYDKGYMFRHFHLSRKKSLHQN
jgi:hypothetical protein